MRTLWFVLVLGLVAAPVTAQTSADCVGAAVGPIVVASSAPRAEFTASTDHATLITGTSTPLLTNYALGVCQGASLIVSSSIGKPTPDASNNIVAAIPVATLNKNTAYYVLVYAVGPGGVSKAGPSGPFVLAAAPAAGGNPHILP